MVGGRVTRLGSAQLYSEGKGEGPTVVLVHGLTLDARMWDAQFEALSASYRVVRIDARGHGRSSGAGPRDDGVDATFSQSADLLGLLDALEIREAHLVGFSMGGFIAYEFALAHPERVLTLSLVNSAWRFDFDKVSDFQMRVVSYVSNPDLEAGLRAWLSDPLFLGSRNKPAVKARLEEIVLGNQLSLGSQSYFANAFNAIAPSPLVETRLAEISSPTLVISGDLDEPEFRAHSEFLAAEIPAAARIDIPGAGHMSPMEKPDEVTSALAMFLNSQ